MCLATKIRWHIWGKLRDFWKGTEIYKIYNICCIYPISSVQFSHSVISDSLRTHRLQHPRLPCPSPTLESLLKFMSIYLVMPSNCLILCCPLLILPSIFPSIRVFSNESVLHIRLAKELELQLRHHSFQWIFRTDFLQDWLVVSPCSPRDSQESSPTPQFKSISSLVLSFLYSPTLTSIHDYWKNHSFY